MGGKNRPASAVYNCQLDSLRVGPKRGCCCCKSGAHATLAGCDSGGKFATFKAKEYPAALSLAIAAALHTQIFKRFEHEPILEASVALPADLNPFWQHKAAEVGADFATSAL